MEEKNSTAVQPQPAQPEKQPVLRKRFPTVGDVLAMLGIAIGAQIVAGVVVMVTMVALGIKFSELQPKQMGCFIFFSYVIAMSLALGCTLIYRHYRGGRGKWAGFSRKGFNPAILLWGFVMTLAASIILEPLVAHMPELKLDLGRGIWTLVTTVLLAPIFEELLCRGVVFSSLRSRYGVVVAWLVSSLFFGILHLQPAQAIPAFIIGLVFCFIYIMTDSLWSSMILHAANNLIAFCALMAGYNNLLLIDLIENKMVYGILYGLALAVIGLSAFMIWRKMRAWKESEKNQPAV